jgi:catechol 2,3-dioxygenase-like lactoylglutathione lyase family enzyme
MLAIETIHHFSVCVTDLARARRFYGGVLGLRELPRPSFHVDGAWYEVGVRQLHLIVRPDATTLRGITAIEPGDGHVALRVASYRDAVAHLHERGVACREFPTNVTPWPQVFVADPDGNQIELNAERLE